MEKIKFPPDFAERAERSVEQAKKYGAACIWCGYATKNTAGKVKRGHIAYHCPDAPEKLKEDMRRAISERNADVLNVCSEKKATSKRRCREKRS